MAYSTKTLAEGCFGKIYKEKFGDSWAAMKRVPEEKIKKKDLERECKVYHDARHPNVVKLLGDPWIDKYKWNIPMEFIFGEDLETTIFKTQISKIQLTPAVKATIITGMCEGLLHLHSKDIVHQDLKPDNIMVEHKTHRAVIIDLGLAKFHTYGLNSAANMGNEAYSAPEILQMRGVRDKRSDVWAMGKIIAELCAGIRLPTPYVSAGKIQETLKDQPYCNPVSRMVESNPSYRAPMAAVISDIRRAASASQMNDRPQNITVTQGHETRGNVNVLRETSDHAFSPLNQPFSNLHMNPFQHIMPFSDLSQSMGSASQMTVRPRENVTLREALQLPLSPLDQQFSRLHMNHLRQMQFDNVGPLGLNHQMPFACPLPETRTEMFQGHFTEQKTAVEYKKIVKNGQSIEQITKFEKK